VVNRLGRVRVVGSELDAAREGPRSLDMREVVGIDGVPLADVFLRHYRADEEFVLERMDPEHFDTERFGFERRNPGEPRAPWAEGHFEDAAEDVFFLHTGDQYPYGLLPMLACACGDPWCGYVGVEVTTTDETVRWDRPASVSFPEEDAACEPATLPVGPFIFSRAEYEIFLWSEALRVVQEHREAVAEMEPGDAEVQRLRKHRVTLAWASKRTRLERVRARFGWLISSKDWSQERGEALCTALSRHDPLNLGELGFVNASSYEGVVDDLLGVLSWRDFSADPLGWLGQYFAKIWPRPADPVALSKAAEEIHA